MDTLSKKFRTCNDPLQRVTVTTKSRNPKPACYNDF